MVAKRSVRGQLRSIGHRFRFFGRAESKELHKILQQGESIVQCAYGYYHGGSGLMVATNKRLILIDKRPFYLNLESLPYEYIKDIDFVAKFLQGTLYLHAGMKRIVFRSVSDARLRNICNFAQDKVSREEKSITKPILNTAVQTRVRVRPYLNPAWRPHHLTFLPKARPSKYHHDPTKPITG